MPKVLVRSLGPGGVPRLTGGRIGLSLPPVRSGWDLPRTMDSLWTVRIQPAELYAAHLPVGTGLLTSSFYEIPFYGPFWTCFKSKKVHNLAHLFDLMKPRTELLLEIFTFFHTSFFVEWEDQLDYLTKTGEIKRKVTEHVVTYIRVWSVTPTVIPSVVLRR